MVNATPAAEVDYDERRMIEYTIMRYHDHLLTAFERAVSRVFLLRWKAQAYGKPDLETRERKHIEGSEDPRIDSVLERGYETFCREVTDRVLGDPRSAVTLNRCPKCGRIVRTPRAKQCMWCYHDWH
jgi:hypothetical protein